MGSSDSSEQHFKDEITENSRVFESNTVLGVDINHLEEFMDSIFSDEVPKKFSDNMKESLRNIRYADRASNFRGKDNDTGLDSNSFKCNNETHYFYFIAERKENKMDISYKFFCGKAEISKAYKIIKGKKILEENKGVNYKSKLKEVVDNPLQKETLEAIKTALLENISKERKLLLDK